MKRRQFVQTAALLGVPGILSAARPQAGPPTTGAGSSAAGREVVVFTWNFAGAGEAAFQELRDGGTPLDAVERGIRVVEADPSVTSVGTGGFPDRDGHLTLDASIMEGTGRCGAVVFMEGIDHPVSVARLVMEQTPHVLLAGRGAEQFAVENGFTRKIALTDQAAKAYENWLSSGGYTPKKVDSTNHDTIGMLALKEGKMAGGCSTSGAAWKMRGRVGDSPIVGAGLFVDDEVGGATATGLGETVIGISGSALIVELMRQGVEPGEACRTAVERIIRKQPRYREEGGFLVGFLALRKDGEAGAFCYRPGFEYVRMEQGVRTIVKSPALEE